MGQRKEGDEVENGHRGIKSIGDSLKKYQVPQKHEPSNIHSEIHELADTIRKYFREDAKKGPGSFGYYLGFFKRIPPHIIYQNFAAVKDSNLPVEGQKRWFWKRIGKLLRESKTKKPDGS